MDAAFRTPLLDLFRRGDVASDVKMLAASGALAPRAHEQLGLLMLLVSDADAEIARRAEATLHAIPRDALAAFLARADVSEEMRTFFAARGVSHAAAAATGSEAPLVDPDPEPVPGGQEDSEESMVQRLASMNVAQRMTTAIKGTREERALLIRDPNKIVSVSVLSSPKLTQTEVEGFARMANVSDEILRIIANTRAWMKSYAVVVALAKNPKTPIAVSMNLLARLTDRDLRTLSIDRNVPDVLRVTARKKIVIDQ